MTEDSLPSNLLCQAAAVVRLDPHLNGLTGTSPLRRVLRPLRTAPIPTVLSLPVQGRGRGLGRHRYPLPVRRRDLVDLVDQPAGALTLLLRLGGDTQADAGGVGAMLAQHLGQG